jgi:hypothetical protein
VRTWPTETRQWIIWWYRFIVFLCKSMTLYVWRIYSSDFEVQFARECWKLMEDVCYRTFHSNRVHHRIARISVKAKPIESSFFKWSLSMGLTEVWRSLFYL